MAKKVNMKALYDTMGKLVEQAEKQVSAGSKIDDSIIEALENGFNDIIDFEKCYLISCQDRFWGNILMDIDTAIDFKQRGAIDLKVDRSPICLTFNPMFCVKYTFSEFTGLVISELTKMVYLHPATFAELNHEGDKSKHEKLNAASDAASNSIVKNDIRLDVENGGSSNGCRLPKNSYTPQSINAEYNIISQEKMPLEYYYKILNKFKKDSGDSQGQSESDGQGQPDPNGIATSNNNNGQATHNWEKSDKDEMKEQITSIVSDAYNNLSEKSRGYVPLSIIQQINALLMPPEINWKQVLAKMVGSVPVPYRKTRTRLNRRQPYRSDLSGKLPKRTVNIVCCFDTSGSVTNNDLRYCMNEVFNIIKSYEGYKVTIVECDAEVQRVYEARKISEVQTKVAGRGGTSFIPAIEYINGTGDYKNNPKFPKAGSYKDALMVYFTDGYGDSSIPKPNTYRNLWVVFNDVKNLSVDNPYGDVKSLSTDKEWQKMKNI